MNIFTPLKALCFFIWHVNSVKKNNCFLHNRYVNISQYEGHNGFYDPSIFHKTFMI